jgi:hypothetical protein
VSLVTPVEPGAAKGLDRPTAEVEPWRTRIPRLLIKGLAIYTGVLVPFIFTVVLVGSHSSTDRAIILMASGLVLLWIVLGGSVMYLYRDPIRRAVLRWRVSWPWRFVLMASALALTEEAITTGMTNLAPEFGSKIGLAFITASNNYLIVIAFSSVVILVPEFVGWMLLLRRWAFTPNEVFLLYGFLGTTMEATLNPTALYAGFWFFVYGLMVYLPAYCVPAERPAARPRWWHYELAYFVPLALALPVAGADSLLGHWLGIHLWSG